MKGRLMGVDYGLKRVGIALSDELRITVTPLQTIQRRGDKQVCREIRELVAVHGVVEIVVGLPLEADGQDSGLTKTVDDFVTRLRNYVSIPVTLFDERFTSIEAEELLRESGRYTKKDKDLLDAAAAAVILRWYLEG